MRIFAVVLLSIGFLFFSCKNQGSDDSVAKLLEMLEEPEPDPEFAKLLDRLENFILTEYLTERDLRTISKDERKFQVYQIDLNNDGKREIFINFVTSYFCGSGGCNMVLLDEELRPITEFTVMKTPLYVEENVENGWKILKIHSQGKWRKLIYKNGSYPSNPSVVEGSGNSPSNTARVIFDTENSEVKTYTF